MHPHYQAIVDAYVQSGRPFFHELTPVAARELMGSSLAKGTGPTDLPELFEVQDFEIDGPNGSVPARRYVPEGAIVGIAIYLHSGGWVLGNLAQGDAVCQRLAVLSGCEVINVDYRLAPEHRYPAPLEDAYAAVVWASSSSSLPLFVAGESAGGNLAAAVAIRARDTGGPAIAGQLLACPVTDCDFETASYRQIGDRNWLLSTADMRWFWDHYCPAGIDRNNPWISPLNLSDAAGLPPAFVRVAELDPVRDEGIAYARKLEAAGVPVDAGCDGGMLHGYWAAAGVVDTATDAVSKAAAWMRARGLQITAQRAPQHHESGPGR